jgi:hypothetical protein
MVNRTMWFLALSLCAAAGPSADTLKQVLARKLMLLKPSEAAERDVLFQTVQPGSGMNTFRVTAIIRDYTAGYPKNRYYGQTCIRRFDNANFVLVPGPSGAWDVEGALTPPLESQQCKPNPEEGVSSIPLSSLQGSPAPGGNPQAAAPATGAGGKVATGSYECWANGTPRMLLNFTIRSATQYTGSDGKPGSYGFDAGNGRISFHGGALDGILPNGFYSIYYEPQGRPTVSFRNASGSEVSFCQRVR